MLLAPLQLIRHGRRGLREHQAYETSTPSANSMRYTAHAVAVASAPSWHWRRHQSSHMPRPCGVRGQVPRQALAGVMLRSSAYNKTISTLCSKSPIALHSPSHTYIPDRPFTPSFLLTKAAAGEQTTCTRTVWPWPGHVRCTADLPWRIVPSHTSLY